MSIRNSARCLKDFLSSVLPADRSFIYLLLGSTFLFIAPSLGWWYEWQQSIFRSPDIFQNQAERVYRISFFFIIHKLLLTPIRVAGAAGFFACFFRRDRPLRTLRSWVYLPSAIGLLATSLFALAVARATPAVQGPWGCGSSARIFRLFSFFWKCGPGLDFTLGGLILVSLAALRFRRGLAVLPIHLKTANPGARGELQHEPDSRDCMRFVWMMMVLELLVPIAAGIPNLIVYMSSNARNSCFIASFFSSNWFSDMKNGVLLALALFLLVCLAIGKAWRRVLRQSLRLPSFRQAGLALILPVAIYAFWPLCVYLDDRVHWAAFEWAHNPTPHFVSYFGFPRGGLCWLFLPALVEEIAWRGYLQPRFIARYGLYRGIFFVGIVWGSFHFSGDFSPVQSHADVFLYLTTRLLGTIAYSFVLGWLTLRSGSVLPAAITHATLNIILYSSQPFPTNIWLAMVLWGLGGLVLFSYWPPHTVVPDHAEPTIGQTAA